MCDTWIRMVYSDLTRVRDSSLEYNEWNPWNDWCKSWKEFQASEERPPYSQTGLWGTLYQLYPIAKLTSKKLDQAKTHLEKKTKENETLRNQNCILRQTCDELQRKLDAEKQRMYKSNLEIEVNFQKTLEALTAYWISQGKCKELEEKAIEAQKALEAQKAYWISQVNQQVEKLQKARVKCGELEEKVSSLQSQLVENSKNPRYQFIKNDIVVVPDDKWKQPLLYPQLQNGENEATLDLDTIQDIVYRLGKVNSSNVFDWLYICEMESKILNWSAKDFEQILRRCMDSSSFISLPPIVKTSCINWLGKCKYIAESFIPNLDDLLDTERMREDDTVLQFFQRMWMIYRITNSEYVLKNDPEYKKAICEGLPPYLYEVSKHLHDEEYEYIEKAVRLLERSSQTVEKKRQNCHMKARKAGAGCPPRMKIWKRLRKHPVPYEEINEASYWKLVVQLSRS
ncbi:uncharacterized protein [Dendropsophus ebraccatus]|uniref:uncharacterized protein n=1 Tax=Dendropsophus ebraccatus TaxID=150705 RepID=UPI003831DDB6